MSGTTMVFLIVLTIALVIGGIVIRLIDKKAKYQDGPKLADLEAKLAAVEQDIIAPLQQRIQVLEKIVTDEGYELRRTINKLDQS